MPSPSIFHAGSGHPGGALSCGRPARLPLRRGDECLARPRWTIRPATALSCPRAMPRPRSMPSGAHYGFCDAKAALTLAQAGTARSRAIPMCWICPGWRPPPARWARAFSVALGMAMGLKLQKMPARVYTLLGDGELQEGEVWEAAMCGRPSQARQSLRRDRLQQAAKRQLATTRSCGWSRWPPNGAPSAGRWPRSTAMTFRAILAALRRAGATREQPVGDHRPHHQGQGRALYGKHSRLAWQREADARAQTEEALGGAGRAAPTRSRSFSNV